MELSSAMDSVIGDDDRGEGGRSVDIINSSLCDVSQSMMTVRSRTKKVRSPRLNETHPQGLNNGRLCHAPTEAVQCAIV
jgi:hypothetical protein